MKEYGIVWMVQTASESSMADFIKAVDLRLAYGWILQGGVSTSLGSGNMICVMQAFVREPQPVNEDQPKRMIDV